MKHIPILAAALALSACATTGTGVVSSQVAGSAESAFQAFLVTEEGLLANGKVSEDAYHANIDAAHNALMLVRLGQMTFDTFNAQLTTLKGGN